MFITPDNSNAGDTTIIGLLWNMEKLNGYNLQHAYYAYSDNFFGLLALLVAGVI